MCVSADTSAHHSRVIIVKMVPLFRKAGILAALKNWIRLRSYTIRTTTFLPTSQFFPTYAQVTVAILLNSFVSAIAATEEEADQAAYASLKSRDLLRWATEMGISQSITYIQISLCIACLDIWWGIGNGMTFESNGWEENTGRSRSGGGRCNQNVLEPFGRLVRI